MTEDKNKFRRWQICNPEVTRTVSGFEDLIVFKVNELPKYNQLEDLPDFQEKFR